jgi:hypothetical protein
VLGRAAVCACMYKGQRAAQGPGVMVVSAVVSGFYATPVVCSVPDVGRASATCASCREHPKSRGVCRHEVAALTGLEAEKSAVVDAENPRELSGAASAAGWHAPGPENEFAGGGVDGSGDGGGGCGGNGGGSGSSGRGELPPGRAAHDAHGEDGSDASSAEECDSESAKGEYRSRVRRPLLACVSDILVERYRRSKIAEVLSAGSRLSAIDLRDIRGNFRSSTCASSASEESSAQAMLISTVDSHEVYREVTLETLMAVARATVKDWHCRRCGKLNRYDGFDDAVVSVSRDFVVCRLKMDVYFEMVFAGGMTLRSAFDTHVKACAALLGAERGRMRGGLGRRQLPECFAWF